MSGTREIENLDIRTRQTTYVEVLGVNVAMLGKVEVLLGHEYTLYSKRSEYVSYEAMRS